MVIVVQKLYRDCFSEWLVLVNQSLRLSCIHIFWQNFTVKILKFRILMMIEWLMVLNCCILIYCVEFLLKITHSIALLSFVSWALWRGVFGILIANRLLSLLLKHSSFWNQSLSSRSHRRYFASPWIKTVWALAVFWNPVCFAAQSQCVSFKILKVLNQHLLSFLT